MTPALLGAGLSVAGIFLAAAVAADRDARRRDRLGVPRRGSRRSPDPRSLGPVLSVLGGGAGWHLAGPVGAVAGAGLALAADRVRKRSRRRRRLEEAEAGLADVVRAMAAASRAGRSVRRSLEAAAAEAPPSLREPLSEAVGELETGRPLPRVLDALGRRLSLPDAALLVGVLDIHLRTGGDLPGALDHVAELVARRQRARRRLRALTAQGRASGAVLAVLPVAFVGLLSGTSGNGLGTFYRTPQGSALLASGLVLSCAGFLWIRGIVRRAEP